jgi:hypothetical protein
MSSLYSSSLAPGTRSGLTARTDDIDVLVDGIGGLDELKRIATAATPNAAAAAR